MDEQLWHDIQCGRCGHTARHVNGRNTRTVYCLECGGECREQWTPEKVAAYQATIRDLKERRLANA